jgi:hypothetical protein
MISYQLFTETAVNSVVTQISTLLPTASVWLSSRMDLIIFVYAFAWVFVLSSAIPSVILGKERGVLAQFFVCLTLTFLAFIILDLLKTYGGNLLNQMLSLSFLFGNPILATLYLSIPYITLIALDLRCRKRNKPKKVFETYVQNDMEPITVESQKK